KGPDHETADHHEEGIEHGPSGASHGGGDRFGYLGPVHDFVSNRSHCVYAVVDTETDAERDYRGRVDSQWQTSDVHGDKGAKVSQHARGDEQQTCGRRSELDRAADTYRDQGHRQAPEI